MTHDVNHDPFTCQDEHCTDDHVRKASEIMPDKPSEDEYAHLGQPWPVECSKCETLLSKHPEMSESARSTQHYAFHIASEPNTFEEQLDYLLINHHVYFWKLEGKAAHLSDKELRQAFIDGVKDLIAKEVIGDDETKPMIPETEENIPHFKRVPVRNNLREEQRKVISLN